MLPAHAAISPGRPLPMIGPGSSLTCSFTLTCLISEIVFVVLRWGELKVSPFWAQDAVPVSVDRRALAPASSCRPRQPKGSSISHRC
jgi:hypothetical protein